VEALLAAAASPLPPPLADLVPDPTLADLVPPDLPGLLARLPAADLYLQDEVEVALHRAGYVCKRPGWVLKRKAEEQEGWAGNA